MKSSYELAMERLAKTGPVIKLTAAQKKALAEHPSDAEAGTAWCADGGSIVLASDEQVLTFQKAAQPVFDKLQQDSFNAASIAAFRALKAKTKPLWEHRLAHQWLPFRLKHRQKTKPGQRVCRRMGSGKLS